MTDRFGPDSPVIDARGLQVTYGRFRAVRGVDLAVRRGELYALLGTNGAGKTSTLEVLEGLRRPSGGSVRVMGADPRRRALVRPQVGTMLQESGFAPDLTVAETVSLAGRLSGRRDDAARVLAQVSLSDKARTRVAQLSGGERRRLDFACAMYGSPRLLFLDEPTTGLDLTSRDQLWDGVGKLRALGTTVVLTTHYLQEAQAYADRVGVMHRGVIHHEGTVADVAASFPGRITFRTARPAGLVHPRDGVPGLAAHAVSLAGDQVTVRTHDLQADMYALLHWAAGRDVALMELTGRPASLEDIFRDLAAGDVEEEAA